MKQVVNQTNNQKKNYSLQKRLLINTSILLVFFIVLMSFILLDSYKSGIKQATNERLSAYFYSLLSVAEQIEVDELFIPEEPQLDARFNLFESGLSGMVYDETETLVWKSISATEDDLELPNNLPGEPTLEVIEYSSQKHFMFHFVTEWESESGDISLYHFVILENKRPFDQVIGAYRNKLSMWLAGLAISLMLLLYVVMRWTLSPIRKMVTELDKVKKGLVDSLSGNYPNEIQQLTDNINRFIVNEREQGLRHKETLGNLAHSLKTPLAVMQSALQNKTEIAEFSQICEEQLYRMNQIVGYQLQRATSGPQVMMKSISIEPAFSKLTKSLEKVYHDKNLSISYQTNKEHKIKLNEGDLYEICGNLLDNACKWAKSTVKISAFQLEQQMVIEIEDDGPGIAESVRNAVFNRGKRLDENVEGQGIGMSVVKEIVDAYQADFEILNSELLGGALIRLTFKR